MSPPTRSRQRFAPPEAGGGGAVGPGESREPVARASSAVRPACPERRSGLERRLFERGLSFDFFQAVRILQRLVAAAPGGFAGPPGAEAVRFRAHVSLSFPASSIHDIHPRDPGPARPR